MGEEFELGALSAGTAAAVGWVLHVASGMRGFRLGVMGEQATAAAVLTRRRRRSGWRLVNGLYFCGHGDVDHVLVGPGGIFVL